jgi:hypothetical protein
VDDSPLSRAHIPWGNPAFTNHGDSVIYTWPAWMEAAWSEGGQWITNLPYAWHSPTGEVTASLNHLIDRGGIASNLAFRVEYLDHTASALHIDLFSTNGTIIATDLFGNITDGQGGYAVSILEIPLSAHPEAVGVQLRKTLGQATVYRSLLYIDSDMDGLDDAQEQQLGTDPHNTDTDCDGLTDYAEVFVYGTAPTNSDTSGDGINDGQAVQLGLDPTQPFLFALLPFLESFEPSARTLGLLAGQGKWQVSLPGTAIVQTQHVFAGQQALQLDNPDVSGPATVVQHDFIGAPSVVWADMYLQVRSAPVPSSDPEEAAVFLFNADGHLVVYDGLQPSGSRWVTLTNAPAIAQYQWARVSVRADYTSQTWLVCLDGILLAQDLGFASPRQELQTLRLQGKAAHFDNIYVGAIQPEGISTVAGNQIPDDWYLQHFSSPGQGDTDDPDGDGLTNLQEYQLGTNPNNSDTSGDGIPDGLAVQLSLDPLLAYPGASLPFSETFEPPAIATGELLGQGNWLSLLPGTALVQSNSVYAGAQALQISAEYQQEPDPLVNHLLTGTVPSAVWIEMFMQAHRTTPPAVDAQGAAVFFFNADGHLVVHDGHQPAGSRWVTLTNATAIAQGQWARVSVRADYTAQTWLVCLDGELIASGLGFASPQSRLHALNIQGRQARFDSIYVGASQPAGLSTVAGNIIPDEWYTNYFGHLQYSDHNDPDADDLTNLDEYQLGTDPTNPDTDGDGFSDGTEVTIGSDPLDPLSYPVTLSGQITYAGTQAGTVHLQVETAQGPRLHTFPLTGASTDFTVPDLISSDDYSVTAFLDTTGDGQWHPWEPIGQYPANPIINLTNNLSGIDITLTEDQQIDTDGDGMSDYAEVYVHGSDPYAYNTTPENGAVLTRQVWYGIPGTAVSELTGDPRYPFDPDQEHQLTPLFEAPGNVANYYGQRILGKFLAPRTGYYTFWIASSYNGELWLTGTNGLRQLIASVPGATSSRQWTRFASQKSALIHLAAGQVYSIEALMNEYISDDHLAVGIQFPDGRLERPMRARWFSAPPPEIDLFADNDGDGLTDYEEWVYGSDPHNTDTTGDGLTDYETVLYGLDPSVADTHGDGLPNWWIVQHGLSPLVPQAYLDANGDGLSNLDSYLHGTDPQLVDSDGDGISDYDEIMSFGSNPLVPDFDGTRSTLLSLPGASADFELSAAFAPLGTNAQSTAYGGWLTYTLEMPTNGHPALVFTVSDPYGYAANPVHVFRLLINGEEIGIRRVVTLPGGQPQELIWVPASLPSGTHEVTLRWDYKPHNSTVRVDTFELVSFGGPDNSGDGRPDWISYRTAIQPAIVPPPAASWVSPAGIEGAHHLYGDVLVTIGQGSTNTALAVHPAPDRRWYADIPLQPGVQTDVLVDWKEGGSWTAAVTWAEFNLLTGTPDALTIRVGDALLLNAHPAEEAEGTGTVSIAGIGTYPVAPGQPQPYTFAAPGQYTVTGYWEGGMNRTVSITVVGGTFAATPAAWIRRTRNWDNPALPAGLVYEGERRMTITDLDHPQGNGRRLQINAHTEGTGYILARLSEAGPILASTPIENFTNYSSTQVHLGEVDSLPDGTRVNSMGIVGQFPHDDITVRITLHGGAVFEDGSTIIYLTKEDFDETGYYNLRAYLAPDVNFCHFLAIFQGDTWIGAR